MDSISCHTSQWLLELIPEFKAEWKSRDGSPYQHCSYCGSIHFDNVRQIISEGGQLSGSDWKYNYPHKFYVMPKNGGQYKFYITHLQDLSDQEFQPFSILLYAATHIEFTRKDGKLFYSAPYYGYQKG